MKTPISQVRIDSYFSLPTDLASAMANWPELVSANECEIELKSDHERVTVALIAATVDDNQHIIVRGEGGGRLFLAVTGCVSYLLAHNSDDVTLGLWEHNEV